MTDSAAADAAPAGDDARLDTHAVPVFEGERSRRHARRSVARFRLAARWHAVRHRRALRGVETFVQFAGWPRSGHSLVGALIDAHPQAAIAHELDAMGLFRKGIAARRLPALCLANAHAFTAAGRHWNGFRYAVPDAPHGVSGRLRVVGDKKGDWASRWSAAEPDLVARLAAGMRPRSRWILITRHPADNVATMSLRVGRLYDRLRIEGGPDGAGAIRDAQRDGRIAAAVDDAMLADYAALAASVAAMKARVPEPDWLEMEYEALRADPRAGLDRLAAFLGLDPDPAWRDRAAALVSPGRRRSRDDLAWRDDQRRAIDAIVARHDFLAGYAGAG